MFILGLLCMGVAIAVLFGDLPAARTLRRVLIDDPAAWFAKWTWSKVLTRVIVLGAFGLCIVLASSMQDGIVIYMAMPELLLWIAAFDVVTFMELSIAVWLVAANVRLRALVAIARTAIQRFVRRVRVWKAAVAMRERRVRRKPRVTQAKGEDGDPWSYRWRSAA